MAENQIWGCCNINNDKDGYLQCTQCKKFYHLDCLGIDSSVHVDWNCPKCNRPKTKVSNNDETPVRSTVSRTKANITPSDVTKRSHKRQALSSPASPVLNEGITHEKIRDIINYAIEKKKMSSLMIDINKTIKSSINTNFNNLVDKIEELQRSVSFISNR